VVSFTSGSLILGERAAGAHMVGWVGPRTGLDEATERKGILSLSLSGTELWSSSL